MNPGARKRWGAGAKTPPRNKNLRNKLAKPPYSKTQSWNKLAGSEPKLTMRFSFASSISPLHHGVLIEAVDTKRTSFQDRTAPPPRGIDEGCTDGGGLETPRASNIVLTTAFDRCFLVSNRPSDFLQPSIFFPGNSS